MIRSRSESLVWDVVKILALFVSVLFGAWRLDEHFVTRTEFRELKATMDRVEAFVIREEHRDGPKPQ